MKCKCPDCGCVHDVNPVEYLLKDSPGYIEEKGKRRCLVCSEWFKPDPEYPHYNVCRGCEVL